MVEGGFPPLHKRAKVHNNFKSEYLLLEQKVLLLGLFTFFHSDIPFRPYSFAHLASALKIIFTF